MHIELSSAFRLSVGVLSDRCVETLRVAADVGDDERVATSLLEDADVFALLHAGLYRDTNDKQTRFFLRTPELMTIFPELLAIRKPCETQEQILTKMHPGDSGSRGAAHLAVKPGRATFNDL